MATVNPAILRATTDLTTVATAIYTVPASGQSVIKRAVFNNHTTAPHTFTVHRVASGGSATTGNQIITARRLQPGESSVAIELTNLVMDAGDAIYALADANTSVNCTMSGFIS